MLLHIIAIILLFWPRFSQSKFILSCKHAIQPVIEISHTIMSACLCIVRKTIPYENKWFDPITLKTVSSSILDNPIKLMPDISQLPTTLGYGINFVNPYAIPTPTTFSNFHKSLFPNEISNEAPFSGWYLSTKVSTSQSDTVTRASLATSQSVDKVSSEAATQTVTSSNGSSLMLGSSILTPQGSTAEITRQPSSCDAIPQSPTQVQLQQLQAQQDQNYQLINQKLQDQGEQLESFAEQLSHIKELLQTHHQNRQEVTQQQGVQQQQLHQPIIEQQQTMPPPNIDLPSLPSVSTLQQDITQHPQAVIMQQETIYLQPAEDFTHREIVEPSVLSPSEKPISTLRLHQLSSLASTEDKFDGDISRYRSFKLKICTLIESMELTNREKALVLYLTLEDDVLADLEDITTQGCLDYHKIWRELDGKYCCPKNGSFSHFAALNSINSWTACNTHKSLQVLYKFINVHYRALTRLGVEDHAEGYTILFLSKLTGTLADRVSTLMNDSEGKPIIPDILNIFSEELKVMELQEIATKGRDLESSCTELTEFEDDPLSSKLSEKPSILKHSNSPCPQQRSNCFFCQNDTHNTHQCRRYRTPRDYQQILFRNYLCFNCHQKGHTSHGCPRSKVCQMCEDPRKHSPVLCRNYHSQVHPHHCETTYIRN